MRDDHPFMTPGAVLRVRIVETSIREEWMRER